MELFIYSGQGELASIDFDCLRIVAYIKFKGIPVKISTNGNPYHSPNGFLPYLKNDTETIAGYDEIISYFQSKGFGTEDYLSSSYLSQFETEFMPYFSYVLWGDPRNAETTRMIYCKKVSFPYNFVYPHKYIKRASDFLNIVANFSIDDKLEHHHTAEMILNAKKYVNMLAERIGKKRWFFDGPKPDEFDAAIYSALSILLHFQLPNNDLKSHINECPNIIAYIERIRKKYLADIRASDSEPVQQTVFNRVQRVFINKEKGTLSNAVVKVMFGILTISSMVFFAVSHGILEIVTDDDDIESIQYYGDENSEQFDDD